MTTILGINAFHAGASACLVVDGRPVFAIAEERINRVKYFGGFPSESIKACLDFAGLRLSEIDHVAWGRDPNANLTRKLLYAAKNVANSANLLRIRRKARRFLSIKQLLSQHFGIPEQQLGFAIHNVEHHVAHAASAFYISPWDSAAGFTLDGSGDFVTCTLSRCFQDRIDVLKKLYVPHSAGTLYTMVCEFIGYPSYGDEGKLMGLAPYGENAYAELFDDMVSIRPGGFRLNPKYFMSFGSNPGISQKPDGSMVIHRHYSDEVARVLGKPRPQDEEISTRDKNLAFGVQRKFEEIYMSLLNDLHREVPVDRVAIAGGCALNSVANGKMFDLTPFHQTTIQPASGDDGLAMGAALYVSNCILKEGRRWHMESAYLGSAFAEHFIKSALASKGIAFTRLDEDALISAAARHISEGSVLGWFQGREEWGPRALGNRSILVHPGFPKMKDILNARIKRREWFRPFAPAVLADQQANVFERTHPSPFMLHVYKIRPEWRDRLSAVNHVDDTGRLQTVTHDQNPLYWKLINEFYSRTGIPVLLNTSFNENEPIVHTPDEAIDCFLRTRMDVLAIGPFLCVKSEQRNSLH